MRYDNCRPASAEKSKEPAAVREHGFEFRKGVGRVKLKDNGSAVQRCDPQEIWLRVNTVS